MLKKPMTYVSSTSAALVLTLCIATTLISVPAANAAGNKAAAHLWTKIASSDLAWADRISDRNKRITRSSKKLASSPGNLKPTKTLRKRSTGSGTWVCSASGFGMKPVCYSR